MGSSKALSNPIHLVNGWFILVGEQGGKALASWALLLCFQGKGIPGSLRTAALRKISSAFPPTLAQPLLLSLHVSSSDSPAILQGHMFFWLEQSASSDALEQQKLFSCLDLALSSVPQ